MPQDMENPLSTEQCVWLDPECFDPHKLLCNNKKKTFCVASTPQWFMSNSDIRYPLLQVSHMFKGIPTINSKVEHRPPFHPPRPWRSWHFFPGSTGRIFSPRHPAAAPPSSPRRRVLRRCRRRGGRTWRRPAGWARRRRATGGEPHLGMDPRRLEPSKYTTKHGKRM